MEVDAIAVDQESQGRRYRRTHLDETARSSTDLEPEDAAAEFDGAERLDDGEPEDAADLDHDFVAVDEGAPPSHLLSSADSRTSPADESTVGAFAPRHPDPRHPDPRRTQLKGISKAAIFVLALDEEAASRLLRCLSDEEMSRVTAEIASLGVVDRDAVMEVIEEFHDIERAQGVVQEGGWELASKLIRSSIAPQKADHLLRLLAAHHGRKHFSISKHVNGESLLSCLQDEREQTVAIVLAHVGPALASDVLARLTPQRRHGVLRRLATLDGASQEALRAVERVLKTQLSGARFASLSGQTGAQAVAQILRASNRDEAAESFDHMKQVAPEIAEEVGKHLLVFEQLIQLEDRYLQKALKRVDPNDLAMALKSTGREVFKKVTRNLSRRHGERLREKIQALGPTRLLEVEAARRRVLEGIFELHEGGVTTELVRELSDQKRDAERRPTP